MLSNYCLLRPAVSASPFICKVLSYEHGQEMAIANEQAAVTANEQATVIANEQVTVTANEKAMVTAN
jgi:hypothetical protein